MVRVPFTCSFLYDLPRKSDDRREILTTDFGEDNLLKALRGSRSKLFSENETVALAVLQRSTQRDWVDVDLTEGASRVEDAFRTKADEFVVKCNKHFKLAGVELKSSTENESTLDGPTCIRWVWENGQFVAKYNYGIVLEAIEGFVDDFKPKLTLHLSMRVEFDLSILGDFQ